MTPSLLRWGLGSLSGLQKLQSSIAGVKTAHIKAFLISLEIYQSVDVENGLAWAIWTSTAQVMTKRKVENQLNPNVCKWSATHRWKALNEGYNFASNLIAIEGLHRKSCAFKVTGVLVVGILGLLGKKNHLDVAPMEIYKVYYMGEGGDFFRIWATVSLVSPKLPVACLSTKGAPKSDLTNLWLVECRFKWVIESLSFFLIPSRSFNMPLYPF
jgi:hypothetical protein